MPVEWIIIGTSKLIIAPHEPSCANGRIRQTRRRDDNTIPERLLHAEPEVSRAFENTMARQGLSAAAPAPELPERGEARRVFLDPVDDKYLCTRFGAEEHAMRQKMNSNGNTMIFLGIF